MNDPAILIEHLDFFYDKTPVLEGISLEVQKGEFLGIIGPNGGGKTTLLKIIMGFLKPSRGKVLLFGSPPKEAGSSIGYVPQANRFDRYFPITALELVLTGLIAHSMWFGSYAKESKDRAFALLAKLRLTSYADKTFGSLSGGLAQRALIARALISDPSFLLLDEPTASIDSETKHTIYEILEELRGKKTILMVTHDLKTALEKVGRILCVERTITPLQTKEVCAHFALGLYHPPKNS